MIQYEKDIQKALKKNNLPKKVFERFHNAFLSLDLTNDYSLFDIKKIRGRYSKDYYRLRKGKFRAIFYFENNIYYIISIRKRDEVYDLWELHQ